MGQNPLMHLFEAYLMAFRHSRETLFKAQAEDLYRKIMALFFDPQKKLIREYSIEKQPEIFEPGHSFEWCCLIAEAKALGVDVSVMGDDKTLFERALKQGLSAKGYVRPNLHENEQTSPYRIWPMLEYMRYLAMSGQSASLASVFDTFSAVFIDHDLPVEYVDYSGNPGFNLIKSTTGYHLINCWQYML
jgi:mannose/cellobiose epimerase-like protein (N-acyl-D-glucosamine 2-epimerase family)